MSDHDASNNAATPKEEMDALLAMVHKLSQMSLDMTRVCIEVQNVVPGIALSKRSLEITSFCLDIKDQIQHSFLLAAAAVAASAPVPAAPTVEWVSATPLTPDQLLASFPKGISDDAAWQVVTIGREPGMFISADDASTNVSGVPGGYRKKKDNRLEALAFYTTRYEAGQVKKWKEVPIGTTAAVNAASPANPAQAVADSAPAIADDHSTAAVIDGSSTIPNPAIGPTKPAKVVAVPAGWVPGDVNLVKINR